jgi:hypothetical protein
MTFSLDESSGGAVTGESAPERRACVARVAGSNPAGGTETHRQGTVNPVDLRKRQSKLIRRVRALYEPYAPLSGPLPNAALRASTHHMNSSSDTSDANNRDSAAMPR